MSALFPDHLFCYRERGSSASRSSPDPVISVGDWVEDACTRHDHESSHYFRRRCFATGDVSPLFVVVIHAITLGRPAIADADDEH